METLIHLCCTQLITNLDFEQQISQHIILIPAAKHIVADIDSHIAADVDTHFPVDFAIHIAADIAICIAADITIHVAADVLQQI